MKKTLSLLMAIVMLMAVTIIPAYAETVVTPDQEHKYEAQFIEEKEWIDVDVYEYEELSYHYDMNNNIDWALVYAVYCYSDPLTTYVVVGERVCMYSGFNYGAMTFYWLYDTEKESFFDIMEIDWDDYEGLEEEISKQNLGRPIGDADFDNELTILDATFIQYSLAGLSDFNLEDSLDGYYCRSSELKYVSDMNRDGVRNIFDVTAIQRKLAGYDIATE